MTSSAEWRRRGRGRVISLIFGSAITLPGAARMVDELTDDREHQVAVTVFWLGLAAIMLLSGSLVIAITLRTRVRVVDGGIEIRELRSRFVPWVDIREVSLHGEVGRQAIRLVLQNGDTVVLPTPVEQDGWDVTAAAEELAGRRRAVLEAS